MYLPHTQIITEGRLLLEFTFDDLMRIRSWHFAIRQHRELIPRSVIGMQVCASVVTVLKKQGCARFSLVLCFVCVFLCFVCGGSFCVSVFLVCV